ncbi:hypothetical protein ACFLSJ_03565 [Verrucomicrobiota bacterium]
MNRTLTVLLVTAGLLRTVTPACAQMDSVNAHISDAALSQPDAGETEQATGALLDAVGVQVLDELQGGSQSAGDAADFAGQVSDALESTAGLLDSVGVEIADELQTAAGVSGSVGNALDNVGLIVNSDGDVQQIVAGLEGVVHEIGEISHSLTTAGNTIHEAGHAVSAGFVSASASGTAAAQSGTSGLGSFLDDVEAVLGTINCIMGVLNGQPASPVSRPQRPTGTGSHLGQGTGPGMGPVPGAQPLHGFGGVTQPDHSTFGPGDPDPTCDATDCNDAGIGVLDYYTGAVDADGIPTETQNGTSVQDLPEGSFFWVRHSPDNGGCRRYRVWSGMAIFDMPGFHPIQGISNYGYAIDPHGFTPTQRAAFDAIFNDIRQNRSSLSLQGIFMTVLQKLCPDPSDARRLIPGPEDALEIACTVLLEGALGSMEADRIGAVVQQIIADNWQQGGVSIDTLFENYASSGMANVAFGITVGGGGAPPQMDTGQLLVIIALLDAVRPGFVHQ